MADVQLDNGYCKIANPIIKALAKTRIPGEANQVLNSIIQKTYGWNKKEDIITVSQFSEMTGLSAVHVCQALLKLKAMNLIVVTEKGNKKCMYRFNKDFESWKLLPKKVTLPKKVRVVTEKGKAITEKGNNLSPNDMPELELDDPKYTYQKTLQKTHIAVFDFWNSKKIKVHRKLTDSIRRKINSALNNGFTEAEILGAIKNYAEIYRDDKYYFSHKWCLEDFIGRGLKNFTDDMEPHKNYLSGECKKSRQDELIDDLADSCPEIK